MFDCSRTMDNVDEIWKGSDGVADYKNSDGLLEVVDGKPLLYAKAGMEAMKNTLIVARPEKDEKPLE